MSKEPKGPRMPDDQKAPELSVGEIQLIAGSIINSLDRLEGIFPFLATREYPLYRQIRHGIETEGVAPNDTQGFVLGSIYTSLVMPLKGIKDEKASMPSIHTLNIGDISLEEYLPETFSEMVDGFREKTQSEMMYGAIKCAAESIIMGELEGGIASVVGNLQGEVLVEIMEILTEYDPEDNSGEERIECIEENEFFRILELDDAAMHLEADRGDKLDEISTTKAVLRKKLVRAIIRSRDGIDSKYGDGLTKLDPPSKGKDNSDAISEVIWKRIVRLAGKRSKGIVIKPAKEKRKGLASKVLLPEKERGRQGLRVVRDIEQA